jgi:O-antigen ligase
MKIRKSYFNLTFFSLFLVIIWDALKSYLSLGSPLIQLSVLAPVLFLGVIVNLNERIWKILFTRPVLIWFIWIIYSIFNTFIFIGKFYQEKNPFILVFSLVVVLIFLLLIITSKRDTRLIINLLIFSYFFRLLLSFVFDSMANLGNAERFGEEFNANMIGFGALFIIGLVFLKKVQFNKVHRTDYLIILLAAFTILITGSRKNFIALILIVLGYAYIYRSKSMFKNFAKYFTFLIFISVVLVWTLNNTVIGERFVDSYNRTLLHSQSGSGEHMFDSRARYYINGWKLFKEHPINGIGLRNYQIYDFANKPLHTEYMTQIAEGGLIGTFLFIYFYGYIFIALLKIRKKQKDFRKLAETHIILLIVMFILFFGVWIYRTPMMWVFIALSIRFIREVKQNKLQLVSS